MWPRATHTVALATRIAFDGFYNATYIPLIMRKMARLVPLAGATTAVIVALIGCVDPMQRDTEQQLRQRLILSNRAYLQASAAGPVMELTRPPSDVELELTNQRRAELDKMSGPAAYRNDPIELGSDLLGRQELEVVAMTLRKAIHTAAGHNLDIEVARIQPGINQTQIAQAEANFDAVFFSNFSFQKLDTPQPPTGSALSAFGRVRQDMRSLDTGIRKNFVSGGQMTLSTQFAREFRNPSFFSEPPFGLLPIKTWYTTNVSLTLNQPLLRNFGADVNRAQIMLAANARREAIQDLRRQLLDTILDTETAYWDLAFARDQLLIQERLLKRTTDDRDQLAQRKNFDASPVRLTEANSFVELRRADVIRARQQVRIASDRLKRLVYSKQLPIAGETLILPLDRPADLPLRFSLLDAVSTALRHRPQLERALHLINDASIRQRVADNQRLPLLDLAATVRYNGSTKARRGERIGDAYDTLTDGDFVDYILTAQFEVPIGNRGPEAVYRQQQLALRQAVANYQRNAEQVVLEVKEALRNLLTTYQLIDAARAARRAASDNLRAIEEQEEAGVALTPEFLLDLKLSTQQRLANAEIQEVQSLSDYNTAIATFFRAMGTLLERNGIEFVDQIAEY